MIISRYTIIGFALGLVLFLAAVVFGYGYVSGEPRVVEARARIQVRPSVAELLSSSVSAKPVPAFAANRNLWSKEPSGSKAVLDRAFNTLSAELKRSGCPSLLDLERNTVVWSEEADCLTIAYRGKNPKVCKSALEAILMAVGYVHVSGRDSLTEPETGDVDSGSTGILESVATKASNVRIVDNPQLSLAPDQERKVFGITISMVIWGILGGLAFAGVCLLNPAIQQIGHVLTTIPLPIVGWINRYPTGRQSLEVLPGMERLLVNLRDWFKETGREIVVTSADAEDGKSVLASGLAISLAQRGLRVTLVDVNFKNPGAHHTFSVPEAPGLAEYLIAPHRVDSTSIVCRVSDHLRVVPAGVGRVYSGILEGPTFATLARELRADSDVVIYDCDAASENEDALAMLGRDAYLLAVVRLGHSGKDSLKLFANQIRRHVPAGGGVVFFGADEKAAVGAYAAQAQPASAVT